MEIRELRERLRRVELAEAIEKLGGASGGGTKVRPYRVCPGGGRRSYYERFGGYRFASHYCISGVCPESASTEQT